MKRATFFVIVALASAILYLWTQNQTLTTENERLTANTTSLMSKAEYYETEAGKSAASVQRLELTNSELKENYAEVCKRADELGVKVKRLQSAATTATQTEVKIITQVRDSIVYRDGVLDSLKLIEWRDPWVSVNGELRDRDVNLNVVSNDTIFQVVHRVPKKFWFIKYGTKAIRQEVMSSNPHTHITYTEYIELK